jgi:hypothetical protein
MSSTEVENLKSSTGSENTEVVYVPQEVQRALLELTDTQFTTEAMVGAWVAANKDWLEANLPDVDKEELSTYGKTILASIQE